MRKNILIFSILSIVILAFVVWGVLSIGSSNDSFEPISECENLEDLGEKDNCYIKHATELNDDSFCDNLEYENLYGPYCYGSANKDREYCNKYGYVFKSPCLMGVADATLNHKLCEETKSYSCITNIAIEKNDSKICEEYYNWKEESFSGKDPEGFVDECLEFIAYSNNDASICEGINVEKSRINCLAILTNNVSVCEGISIEVFNGIGRKACEERVMNYWDEE